MQKDRQNTSRRGFRGGALVPAVLATLVALPALAGPATSHDLDDRDIRGAVESEFLFDSAVPFHSVDVAVSQGIVTLSGTVDTILSRDHAVEVAQTIKGVRAVVDEIRVEPAPRSDDALRRDVEWALINDPAADSYEVAISARDGVVRLSGTVDSWQEKQLVRRVVEGVKGVKEVQNDISFEIPAARPDPEIAAEIRERLRWNAWIDDGLIEVAVDDGKVSLTGTVGSAFERARAMGQAWVPGVEDVDATGLEVQWWARDEMRRDKYHLKSDDQIRQAVQDALLYDPRVYSFNADVRVKNGVATLSGVVDNLEARRAAERDARNTVGVAQVRNHLRVKPTNDVDDQEITLEVQRAFRRDPFIDRFEIGVTTFGGEISLSGEVDTWFEKSRAETVAAGVQGTVEIHNNLQVREKPPIVADRVLEEKIEDELFWSPFVDSDEVNVSVVDRVATLTGTVDTWADRAWAAQNAREAGASSVRNDIKVRDDQQGAFWMPF